MAARNAWVAGWAAATFVIVVIATSYVFASEKRDLRVDELRPPAVLNRDEDGVVHITAPDEESMAYAQGYVHARDRLFQMDLLRRTGSGTLAELIGPAVINDDVELRTIGIRRAAERTLHLLDDRVQAALRAYARGVNAYRDATEAPGEYQKLGLSTVASWTPLDSVTIAKLMSFQLSANLDDVDRTEALLSYQGALGPERGAALFFRDLWRVAPFEAIAALPNAQGANAVLESSGTPRRPAARDPVLLALASSCNKRLTGSSVLRKMLRPGEPHAGSNAFAVSGRLAKDGRPLLANDPHLDLSAPSIFYPIHLRVLRDGFDVRGASFPGLPYVVQGVSLQLAWGLTTSGVDVTDVYVEQLINDPETPSGQSTLYQGKREFVLAIPQTFLANVGGRLVVVPVPADQGGVTLIVPRRNNGPIIGTLPTGQALSLQWSGFGPTFEIEAFRGLSRARNRADFEAALQRFDVGSQNFLYADRAGTIAYYLSGEVPLREDLQAESPGVPPFLIRDGQGGQEWITLVDPPADQALPYAILPFDEMPKAVNPETGYLVTANNDPIGDTFDNDAFNQVRAGGGIRYLGADFNIGIRAKRIDELIGFERGGELSLEDMQAIQADVTMFDAKIFVGPQIVRAFDSVNGSTHPMLKALASDPGVSEAVERLRRWRFTAPTGVPEGYDSADDNGRLLPPSGTEIDESIAATLYSLWRSQMIANTIDRALGDLPKPRPRYAIVALRHLLDSFGSDQGIGASGLDFFDIPGVAAAASTRRDIIILQSVSDALDRLASADFAPAFSRSTNQDDYRWGRLHRLEIEHPLGGAFSFTSPEGAFPPPFQQLQGLPIDGGFETVDRATHDVRAGLAGGEDPMNDFVSAAGPVDRFVVRLGGIGNQAENAIPGGVSGVPESPFYTNLLGPWLTNESFRFGPCGAGCGAPEILVPDHATSPSQ